jgi:malonyl-CoA/methylmalonyl-CoA synthetase
MEPERKLAREVLIRGLTMSPRSAPPSPLLARLAARAREARSAILDDEGVHGYAAIEERSRRAAGALLQGKTSLEGRRIALLVSPGAAWVEAFFGVVRAGGCAVVLSPLHPEAETSYFCDDAEVSTLVASPDLAPRLDNVARSRRLVSTDELRAHAPTSLPEVTADDAALQLYTSGTTGKPKGAILTHANLSVQQDVVARAWSHAPGDLLVHALPLHHLHGLGIALLNLLGSGASARLLAQFDAERVWESLAGATLFMGVPTMYTKLFAAFDAADERTRARWSENAGRLRLATSGSAALPVTLGERWRALSGAYPLERFGMTEIGVGMSNPLAGPRKPGMVGLPLETVETRIVGEAGGSAAATGDGGAAAAEAEAASGELWVRGPSVFAGYWKREEATAAAFVEDRGGRWFKTGDTVTRDVDGYFKILGRTSVDILKSGGYKLSALEIEEVLREHASVAEVAVVGLPDETWGERVVACVVPRAGHACDEAALRSFAKERLASYKVPKEVIGMRELPRNAVGKVVKPDLVKRLREPKVT